ncbi:Cytochrome c oxidase assembly protein COX16, mitochondrial [Ceratocystis lukuohia]|uniref:Cytochrome c oxidase assembly protein COX16, mitochondrial n=1 Tax=Ceratocystis lukuohia TaxID=2019550 RepID=A0ABR4MUA3_9PEZI
MAFTQKKFRSARDMDTAAGRYRQAIGRHPFLLFGLPFLFVITAGSFVLTCATAVRYERHDRKVRQVLPDKLDDVRKASRKVSWEDEYQKLCADKDLENWSQKRAPRLPGEPDGRM